MRFVRFKIALCLCIKGAEELRAQALESGRLGANPGPAVDWKSLASSFTSLHVGFPTLGIIMASSSEGFVKIKERR